MPCVTLVVLHRTNSSPLTLRFRQCFKIACKLLSASENHWTIAGKPKRKHFFFEKKLAFRTKRRLPERSRSDGRLLVRLRGELKLRTIFTFFPGYFVCRMSKVHLRQRKRLKLAGERKVIYRSTVEGSGRKGQRSRSHPARKLERALRPRPRCSLSSSPGVSVDLCGTTTRGPATDFPI